MTVPPPARPAAGLPRLTGLTADSRRVRPGFLFAALPGSKVDGRRFIADAIAAGAVAILAPEGTTLPPESGDRVALLTDPVPRRAFALLAAQFYSRQPDVICAVTGTNGKTSVASFTRQIWSRLGFPAASMGTLGLQAPGFHIRESLTTPDPVALHADLAELERAGIQHLAMEASSHGLDQHRLDGVRVAAAAFTNLDRDHLDYHGTMEAYRAAKARLFTEVLQPEGTAVLNAAAPHSAQIGRDARAAGRHVLTYGRSGDGEVPADIALLDLTVQGGGQTLALDVQGQRIEVHLPLVGTFQAENALAALGLALATGSEAERAVEALEHLTGARGRLELVAHHPAGAPVFVDYAHKPGALEANLLALRPFATGRLVVVFGCGGDRDRGKRPIMGEIAARLADRVIVTDDNPRTEDPAAIRAEVLAGCPGAEEIGDRADAIRAGLADLRDGDVLLIAGKGHEQGQIIGDSIRPFDDAGEARKAIAALNSGAGA